MKLVLALNSPDGCLPWWRWLFWHSYNAVLWIRPILAIFWPTPGIFKSFLNADHYTAIFSIKDSPGWRWGWTRWPLEISSSKEMLQKILQFNDFYIFNFKTVMGREFVSREASVVCRMTVILWEYRKSGFQISSNTFYHVTPLQNILLLVTQSPVLFYISCLCR